jgi:hypothetical protein
MKTFTKRIAIATALALVLIVAVLSLRPFGDRGYRAESLVLATSYTNVLVTTAFELNFIQAHPSVIRLRGTAGAGGVVLRIVTVASTAQQAEHAADRAAEELCRTVSTNYGVRSVILEQASRARNYSYFRDRLTPAVSRFFKH